MFYFPRVRPSEFSTRSKGLLHGKLNKRTQVWTHWRRLFVRSGVEDNDISPEGGTAKTLQPTRFLRAPCRSGNPRLTRCFVFHAKDLALYKLSSTTTKYCFSSTSNRCRLQYSRIHTQCLDTLREGSRKRRADASNDNSPEGWSAKTPLTTRFLRALLPQRQSQLRLHDVLLHAKRPSLIQFFVHKTRNLKFNNRTRDFKHAYPQNL